MQIYKLYTQKNIILSAKTITQFTFLLSTVILNEEYFLDNSLDKLVTNFRKTR